MKKSKIVVIVGPTASSKTKVSIEVAKKLDAEVINADAVQVYKDVNIGSAKTTKKEMEGIRHHLIDFVSLNDKYTIYDYQKDGRRIIDELIRDNKNIVIVGGSGLYIKSLLYNYDLKEEEKNHKDYSEYTNEELKKLVDSIDINNDIHINNRKRMERFLEHYENTGLTISNSNDKDKPLYEHTIIYLKPDREELYNRINKRVDIMFKDGLLEEAKSLFDNGVDTNNIIGYKELNKYFNNECSLDEAKEEIKKNTRHYAKRQMTWFNNQFKDKIIINVNYNDFNKTLKEVLDVI